MKIEVKRKVKKEVEETVTMELKSYWVVRVVRIGAYDNKEVIAEVEYPYEPKEQEISNALIEYENKKVFASVIKNYKFFELKEQK